MDRQDESFGNGSDPQDGSRKIEREVLFPSMSAAGFASFDCPVETHCRLVLFAGKVTYRSCAKAEDVSAATCPNAFVFGGKSFCRMFAER